MTRDLAWVADYLDGKIKGEFVSRDILSSTIREHLATSGSEVKPERAKRPTKLAVNRAREAGRSQGNREASAVNAVSRSRLGYLRRMLADALRETTGVLWGELGPDVPPEVGEELDRRALLLVQILQGVEREIGSVVEDFDNLAGAAREHEPWDTAEERVAS